jgi:hypothetical protein
MILRHIEGLGAQLDVLEARADNAAAPMQRHA